MPIRVASLIVLCALAGLGAQSPTKPAKFGFFGTASLQYSNPTTLVQPAGSPFGVPEPRYEIGRGTAGIGGGVLVGLAVRRFGFFGTMDILKSDFDLSTSPGHYSGSSFMSDLGVRYDIPFVTARVQPYVVASIGFYSRSFKTGDPTIYTGPGGGYDSGITTYEGSMGSYGVGVEVGRWLLPQGVGVRRLDIRLVSSGVSFDSDYPPESVRTLRLSAGMTWWIRKGLN